MGNKLNRKSKQPEVDFETFAKKPEVQEALEETAAHALNKDVNAECPPLLVEQIESSFPIVKGKPAKIKELYDAAVKEAPGAWVHDSLEVISKIHNLKDLYAKKEAIAKKEYEKEGNEKGKKEPCDFECVVEMTGIYNKYFDTSSDMAITVPMEVVNALKAASKIHWIGQKNPNKGAWSDAEYEAIKHLRDFFKAQFPNTKSFKDLVFAKKSYYNKLLDFDDDYYGNSYDYYGAHSDYSQINRPSHYSHNDNGNYIQSSNPYIAYNKGFADPTLILLIGLMFCLCFAFAALANIMSCVGCYVFAQYQSMSKKKQSVDDVYASSDSNHV